MNIITKNMNKLNTNMVMTYHSRGWKVLVYIGYNIHREPLDQNNLRDSIDAT
jgi:hypothetical protein